MDNKEDNENLNEVSGTKGSILLFGLTSRVWPNPTENQVLFCDYDYSPLKSVLKKAEYLLSQIPLNSLYVGSTGRRRGYHLVSFDVLPINLWRRALTLSKCHDGYQWWAKKDGYAILRFSNKLTHAGPRWIKTIVNSFVKWKSFPFAQSEFHAREFQKHWDIPESQLFLVNPNKISDGEYVFYYSTAL